MTNDYFVAALTTKIVRQCRLLARREGEEVNPERRPPPRALPPYGELENRRVEIVAIDISRTMSFEDVAPTRLAAAKSASLRLLEELATEDPQAGAGVVVFGLEGRCLVPPQPINTAVVHAQRTLDELIPIRGTNLGDGLAEAFFQMQRIQRPRRPRISLYTTGISLVGPNPVKIAQQIKAQGIQLDIFGVGGSPAGIYDAELLQMASEVNGERRYRLLQSAEALFANHSIRSF